MKTSRYKAKDNPNISVQQMNHISGSRNMKKSYAEVKGRSLARCVAQISITMMKEKTCANVTMNRRNKINDKINKLNAQQDRRDNARKPRESGSHATLEESAQYHASLLIIYIGKESRICISYEIDVLSKMITAYNSFGSVITHAYNTSQSYCYYL